MKLNLGCGIYKRDGYFGIDILDECGADLVHDLNTGIPFDNDSVDEIYSSHFLEHCANVYFMLDEIYRVCKNGSKVYIRVPCYALGSPDHIHCFYPDWFERNINPSCYVKTIGHLTKKFNILYKKLNKIRDTVRNYDVIELYIELEVTK